MANTNGRLLKELQEVGKDDSSGVKAQAVTEGNLRHLTGTIQGPNGTVYEGGVFDIDIIIPKQYPFEPPKMKYTTKIWHPNISSQTGAICLVRETRGKKCFVLCQPKIKRSLTTLLLSGYFKRPVESSLDY
jgi:ubiquitin-protein ligase